MFFSCFLPFPPAYTLQIKPPIKISSPLVSLLPLFPSLRALSLQPPAPAPSAASRSPPSLHARRGQACSAPRLSAVQHDASAPRARGIHHPTFAVIDDLAVTPPTSLVHDTVHGICAEANGEGGLTKTVVEKCSKEDASKWQDESKATRFSASHGTR